MPQSYAIKRNHGCTTFSRNSFARLCCCYSLGESSFLIKSILASLHLGNPYHLLSGLSWDSFTISVKVVRRAQLWGSKSPPLEEEGTQSSLSSWCFLFTNIILAIGDMSLIGFLFLCPYAQQFSCSFISQFNSQLSILCFFF